MTHNGKQITLAKLPPDVRTNMQNRILEIAVNNPAMEYREIAAEVDLDYFSVRNFIRANQAVIVKKIFGSPTYQQMKEMAGTISQGAMMEAARRLQAAASKEDVKESMKIMSNGELAGFIKLGLDASIKGKELEDNNERWNNMTNDQLKNQLVGLLGSLGNKRQQTIEADIITEDNKPTEAHE